MVVDRIKTNYTCHCGSKLEAEGNIVDIERLQSDFLSHHEKCAKVAPIDLKDGDVLAVLVRDEVIIEEEYAAHLKKEIKKVFERVGVESVVLHGVDLGVIKKGVGL